MSQVIAIVGLSVACGVWVWVQRYVAKHDPGQPGVEGGDGEGCSSGSCGSCGVVNTCQKS